MDSTDDEPVNCGAGNPLLLEDVLDRIFVYFEEDAKTLKSFRLVSKTWNTAACRTIKKNLRWTFGPTCSDKNKFLQVMSKCNDDLFRNFLVCHHRKHNDKKDILKKSDEFLHMFGSRIVDLQLKSYSSTFVAKYLANTSRLGNLECLELYDISRHVMGEKTLLDGIQRFEKLKTVCFNPNIVNEVQMDNFEEGEAKMVFNILRSAATTLEHLEINLPKTTARVLNEKGLVQNITKFVTCHPDVDDDDETMILVTLNSNDMLNLKNNCPKLKILSTCIHLSNINGMSELFDILSARKNQLEELDIGMNTRIDLDDLSSESDGSLLLFDTTSESESGDIISSDSSADEFDPNNDDYYSPKKRRRLLEVGVQAKVPRISFSFPDLPKLKKLRLIDWKFNNNFHFLSSMPNLTHVELKSMNCELPVIPLPTDHANPNVQCLKFRWALNFSASNIEKEVLEGFAMIFPNIVELDVELSYDSVLRTVFQRMPQLKRLHLNKSLISNNGITGIKPENMKELTDICQSGNDMLSLEIKRDYPYVGDLKDLQHLTCKLSSLTNVSVYFGIIWLKELTYLRLQPFRKPLRDDIFYFNRYDREPVAVLPIVRYCKNLIRLDVNDYFSQDDEDGDWKCPGESGSDESEDDKEPNYKGCGISENDLKTIKAERPHLDIVLGEKNPFETKTGNANGREFRNHNEQESPMVVGISRRNRRRMLH